MNTIERDELRKQLTARTAERDGLAAAMASLAKILGGEDIVTLAQLLVDTHKSMCLRLRDTVDKHKLGLGGEKLDELVCDKLDALQAKNKMLTSAITKHCANCSGLCVQDRGAKACPLRAAREVMNEVTA